MRPSGHRNRSTEISRSRLMRVAHSNNAEMESGSNPPRLVGIARMAAESPHVRERADIDYFALETQTALNRESTGRMPFAWTINPYRGCEFGCKYCYARYTHEFMELRDGYDFESKIYAKVN